MENYGSASNYANDYWGFDLSPPSIPKNQFVAISLKNLTPAWDELKGNVSWKIKPSKLPQDIPERVLFIS